MPSEIHSWTHVVARARSRSSRARRASDVDSLEALIDDALTLSTVLIQKIGALQTDVEDLKSHLDDARRDWEQLLDAMPMPCIATDDSGLILVANAAAASLLRSSSRALSGRLLLMFCEQRDRATHLLDCARTNGTATATVRVRPRDHAPRDLQLTIVAHDRADTHGWLWFFRSAGQLESGRSAP